MRTVDQLLTRLKEIEGFSEVEREVLRHRIEQRPSPTEINAARLRLAPGDTNTSAWLNIVHPPEDS
jgi:hypothetical protein